jgi:hypothetical protein
MYFAIYCWQELNVNYIYILCTSVLHEDAYNK